MAKQSFEDWFKKVDAAVKKLAFLSAHDLPDCPYMDWYNDGVSPSVAAKRAIKRAMDD